MDKGKGIKLAAKEPYYVIEINADKNEIIVGSKNHLIKKEIFLKNLNLLTDIKEFKKKFCQSKIYRKVVKIKYKDQR